MTRIPRLYPGEQIVPHEGGPWAVGDAPIVEFIEHMNRTIANVMGVPAHMLSNAKQCLSCGAYQTFDGVLPCDH
jgi:hypothetical protein